MVVFIQSQMVGQQLQKSLQAFQGSDLATKMFKEILMNNL